MENEIKVNDFVRLKNGRIVKVKDVDKEKIYFDSDIYFLDGIPVFEIENIFSDFIVKHSPNLIDLIQCGDYVNGKEVTEIKEWNSSKDGYFKYAVTCHYEIIRADEIKTIVTKEMMESISYKVERN